MAPKQKGALQNVTLKKQRSSSKQKLNLEDIDELFDKYSKKTHSGVPKVDPVPKPKPSKSSKESQPTTETKKPRGSKDDLFGDVAKGRKRTEDGWPVYTEEELGLTKRGGNTDLCPFDCDCCY